MSTKQQFSSLKLSPNAATLAAFQRRKSFMEQSCCMLGKKTKGKWKEEQDLSSTEGQNKHASHTIPPLL